MSLGKDRGRQGPAASTAGAERVEEAAFARREGATREPRDVESAFHGRPAGDAEGSELAPFDFLGDRVPRQEGDAETFTRRSLDASVDSSSQVWAGKTWAAASALGDAARARPRLAYEQGVLGDLAGSDVSVAHAEQARPSGADDFVADEGLIHLDPHVRVLTATAPARVHSASSG